MTGRFSQPLWILPLAIAGLVAVLGWWDYRRLRQTIEEQLKAELSATLDANVTALEIWTTNQAKLAISLAEEPKVRALAIRTLEAFDQRGLMISHSRFDDQLKRSGLIEDRPGASSALNLFGWAVHP